LITLLKRGFDQRPPGGSDVSAVPNIKRRNSDIDLTPGRY